MVEKTNSSFFTEVRISRSMLIDHIPDKYEKGLDRAFEALLTRNAPEGAGLRRASSSSLHSEPDETTIDVPEIV